MKVIDFYGVSGSGKTTMAEQEYRRLTGIGCNCVIFKEPVDDNVWLGVNTLRAQEFYLHAKERFVTDLMHRSDIDYIILDSSPLLDFTYVNYYLSLEKSEELIRVSNRLIEVFLKLLNISESYEVRSIRTPRDINTRIAARGRGVDADVLTDDLTKYVNARTVLHRGFKEYDKFSVKQVENVYTPEDGNLNDEAFRHLMKFHNNRISWSETGKRLSTDPNGYCEKYLVSAMVTSVSDQPAIIAYGNNTKMGRGCLRKATHGDISNKNRTTCNAVHSEVVALTKALTSKSGVTDVNLYITAHPCIQCAAFICFVNATTELNIKNVYYIKPECDVAVTELFKYNNINLIGVEHDVNISDRDW